MTLIDRPLLISDRPTLVDPIVDTDDVGNEGSEEEGEEKRSIPDTIGDGGGKTVHGIEFEEGHEDIVKSANLVAMLATGQDKRTDLFTEIFANSSIQLYQAKEMGKDVSGLTASSEELNAHTIGVDWESDEDSVEEEVEAPEDEDSEE